MSSAERISTLLFRHLRGELTGTEEEELENWRTTSSENEALFLQLTDEESVRKMMKEYYYHEERGWDKLVRMAPELDLRPVYQKKNFIKRTAIAASILLTVGTVCLVWMLGSKPANKTAGQTFVSEKKRLQGAGRAMLTLSDGTAIRVDSIPRGVIASQGNIIVIKKADDQLSYDAGPDPASGSLMYNTLETSRGIVSCLVLSDRTKVWLSAGSQLRYPASFPVKERAVELIGEAYFEVTKDSLKPFKVLIGEQATLEVLGTHFNVLAYPEEPSCALTLLEGKVKLNTELPGHPPLIISRGEEARWNKQLAVKITGDIDTAQTLSWKNGLISFKEEDLEGIMHKIARWYDVEVLYKGHFTGRKFTGGIPANTSLADLVKVFALYHIHVQLEGKQFVVTP